MGGAPLTSISLRALRTADLPWKPTQRRKLVLRMVERCGLFCQKLGIVMLEVFGRARAWRLRVMLDVVLLRSPGGRLTSLLPSERL